ncbi:MAG: hypothetical protein DHS20C08_23790 [Rhodomicrobium sp.]|nr:MAG: hypothetical protein DHS20C08_23790 [Rhodomicrobium sp.]
MKKNIRKYLHIMTTPRKERQLFMSKALKTASMIGMLSLAGMAGIMISQPAGAFERYQEQGDALSMGVDEFTVHVPRGEIIVNSYMPSGFTASSPVWVVIHGARRGVGRHIGFDYFSVWKPLAEKYNALLLLPEFTADKWPTSWQFQTGNVRTPKLHAIAPRNQGFAVVRKAFAKAVRLTGSQQRKFSLYGHGGGGQWVQRYMLHTGGHMIDRAIAANPGWYMLPDYQFTFPYGLRGNPIAKSTLRRAFAADMVLLLGQADVSHGDPMRKNASTNAQGRNRFERGHFYFDRSRRVAGRLGGRFNWHLHEVPGAGHENREMAGAAAMLLAR